MGISKIVIEIWKTTYEYKYNRLDVQCKLDWELLNCPQDNTLQCTQDHFEVNCSTNSMHAWAFVQDYNEELMKIDTCEIWQWWHENEWKWSGSSKNDMTSTCYLLSSSLISQAILLEINIVDFSNFFQALWCKITVTSI